MHGAALSRRRRWPWHGYGLLHVSANRNVVGALEEARGGESVALGGTRTCTRKDAAANAGATGARTFLTVGSPDRK
jgi:hypothetical protein